MEENVYTYTCNWITMLYGNNNHNIAIQLYFNKK